VSDKGGEGWICVCGFGARQLGRAGEDTTAAITAQLAQALAANASLRELALGGNHLGWRACRELLEVLVHQPTLRRVGLSHNDMTGRNLSGFVQARARPYSNLHCALLSLLSLGLLSCWMFGTWLRHW
jgi:Ran GTPase-activating protein (RanGAP) involved in mRNA processing and transport